MTEPLQPFYDYLMERRRALLTELDEIEKILGTSPRTSEIRKANKGSDNRIYQKHKGERLETNTPPRALVSSLVECGSVAKIAASDGASRTKATGTGDLGSVA